MSFRGRLTLFFVAIVIVPIATLAVLVIELTEDARDGKADARLATGLEAARALYESSTEEPAAAAEAIADRPGFAELIIPRHPDRLAAIAEAAVERGKVQSIEIRGPGGALLASAGERGILSAAEVQIQQGGEVVGAVTAGSLTAEDYVARIESLTGIGAAVIADDEPLASTFDAAFDPSTIGDRSSIELPDGTTARIGSLILTGAEMPISLFLLVSEEEGLAASSPLVLAGLALFLAIAVGLIAFLLRSLQGQIAEMLAAARSIGGGDFSAKVPVHGSDEMAGLAGEFNLMSGRLSEQVSQLRRQREQLEQSVRRLGEAFASGLDRRSLLEIVADTAVSACDAAGGIVVLESHPDAPITAGLTEDLAEVLERAAAGAAEGGEISEADDGGAHAIAHVLIGPGEDAEPVGTIAIARRETPFGPSEREVLRYLVGQAAVSVENIELHERVSEQAITDGLTGLANKRHFDEWIERETARVSRFGGELSLLMLDLDDFKSINDRYGHPQGDAVLEMIGAILSHESRGIDEAARYGGEEFVIALPETPTEGAVEVAERIRAAVASSPVAIGDGNGSLNVTASIGVASMPVHAADSASLIAAADAALYRAKREGKDRVAVAAAPNGPAGAAPSPKQRWWRA